MITGDHTACLSGHFESAHMNLTINFLTYFFFFFDFVLLDRSTLWWTTMCWAYVCVESIFIWQWMNEYFNCARKSTFVIAVARAVVVFITWIKLSVYWYFKIKIKINSIAVWFWLVGSIYFIAVLRGRGAVWVVA